MGETLVTAFLRDTGKETKALKNGAAGTGAGLREGRRRFHRGVKQGDNMSGAADSYGVNPETGDVIDPEGEGVGNLNGE